MKYTLLSLVLAFALTGCQSGQDNKQITNTVGNQKQNYQIQTDDSSQQ